MGAEPGYREAEGGRNTRRNILSHILRSSRRLILLAVAVPLILGLLGGSAVAKPSKGKGHVVNTMTRNIYLGADLIPAIAAKSTNEFVEANGQILREVTANNFPRRARGLAAEILKKKPDLVGLQEVALWRTAPPSLEPLLGSSGPTATAVRYDYLQLLMQRLNKGKKRYRVAIVQNEFDFEAPANENGVPDDGPNGLIKDAEINGRLTMRDAILVRLGAGVVAGNARGGNFQNLLVVNVSGVEVKVLRGWTAVDAKVRGTKKFRFVNTHLEAFDDETQVPSIRALQAGELVAKGGPATSRLPVILVGDLNSDDDTVAAGDRQAYQVLVKAGMRNRSTDEPLSCCLKSSLLAEGAGGSVADFDHQVDHILTRDPKVVKLIGSSVTGRRPVNGFWNSDHAGVFSSLRLLR